MTALINTQTFRKFASSTLTALTTFALAAQSVAAQITNPATGNLGSDAEAARDGSLFASYFVTLWRAVISIGGIAVVVLFIWGAFEWLTSGGEASKADKARLRMTNAAIGLFILSFTFIIINYISALFFGDDFQILNLTFPEADSSL